jgi:hypothetical protein
VYDEKRHLVICSALEDSASTLILLADAVSQRLGMYVVVMMVRLLSDGKISVHRYVG